MGDCVRFKVTKTGFYAPPRIQTAEELAPLVGKSPEWIIERTRVHRRRVSEEPVQQMAAKAARAALGDGPKPDLVVNASLTPVQLIPDSSVFLQQELGYEGIPSFSIHATCLSFVTAMHTVGALVSSGAYKRVLVVSAEMGSVSRDFNQPESAVLIGDGAGAVIIEPTPEGEASELLAFRMSTLPKYADLTEFRGAGVRHHPNDPATSREDNLFQMSGPKIYRRAMISGARVIRATLEAAEMTPDQIDWVVPHQASGPALDAMPRFGFKKDRMVDIIEDYGNCIAASVPMALSTLAESGRLERGQTVMFMGTGAGLSLAAAILRW